MKVFLTVFLSLVISSYAIADDCSNSPYWTNRYKEQINENFCLSISHAAGAEKSIMVDTMGEYLGLDRVWLEVYDWNGDGKADWIRLTNYLDDNFLQPDAPYEFGAESIKFYHGPEELKKMIRQYDDWFPSFVDFNIPENEMGTNDYNGHQDGLEFKPISDPFIIDLFTFADELLAHDIEQSGSFASRFENTITNIMSKKVLDLPAEWRKFKQRE